MGELHPLEIIGGVIGLITYYPFIRLILKTADKQSGVSFASFFLWSCLDVIALVSIVQEDGSWLLPAIYTCGAVSVAALLAFQKRIRWGAVENSILVLVVVCTVVYFFVGPYWALRASLAALALAGAPQVVDSWKEEQESFKYIWLSFFSCGALTSIGVFLKTESFILADIGYPGIGAVQGFLIVIFSFFYFASMDIKTRLLKTLELCSVMFLVAGKVGLAVVSVVGWPLSFVGYALTIGYNYLTGKLILAMTLVGVVGTCGYGWYKWSFGIGGIQSLDYYIMGGVAVTVLGMWVAMYFREATERSMSMNDKRGESTIHREALVMLLLFTALLLLGWQHMIAGWALMAFNHAVVFTVYRQGGDKMLMWLQIVSFFIAIFAMAKEIIASFGLFSVG